MKGISGIGAALLGSAAALALNISSGFAGQAEELKAALDNLQSQLDQIQQQDEGKTAAADSDGDNVGDETPQPRRAKASIDALTPGAADAVVGGDIPRSFKLPGSDTSVAIKMLVKADFIYDFDQQLGDSAQWFLATPKGVVQPDGESQNRRGAFRFDARFSRLTFETRTPTAYGPISTFIDADFWGGGNAGPGGIAPGNAFVTNSYAFELRDAFATLGPILVGQFITNILDPEAYGELLDHFGPPGETVTVQPQIRYTQNWGNFTVSVTAENPQSDWMPNTFALGATGTPGAGSYGSGFSKEEMPDFTAAVQYSDFWGHLRLAGLLRRIGAENGAGSTRAPHFNVGAIGGGGVFSGTFNLSVLAPMFGNDQVGWNGFIGSGMGRYVSFGGGLEQAGILRASGGGPTATYRMVTLPEQGGFAWYQHNWSDSLRSTVDAGIQHNHWGSDVSADPSSTTLNGNAASNSALATLQSALIAAFYANLLWSPLPQTTFGLEFMYGRKVLRSGNNNAGFNGGGFPVGAPISGTVDVKRLMAEAIFSF